MQIIEEDVDDMVAVLKLGGVYRNASDYAIRAEVRRKLAEGKVPCFEQMKWVPREKNDENK